MPKVEIKPHGKHNCVLRVFEKPLRSETSTLLFNMPGFHKFDGYDLIFRPTGANIHYVRTCWPDADWLDGTNQHLVDADRLHQESARVINFKTAPLPPINNKGYQYKRLPRDHQRRALLMSWSKKYFALLMEQRTGKTKVVIDNVAYLNMLHKVHRFVIITLNGVHRNWIINEIPSDLPDWCYAEMYLHQGRNTIKERAQFDKTLHATNLGIFAFNFEAFSTATKARVMLAEAIGDGQGVFCAIDESSDGIKTYKSARTKFILDVASKAEYRRILTGTQTPEGRPDELFPQYLFLSEDVLGYDTITTFRNRYCVTRPIELVDDTGNKRTQDIIVPGVKNLDELTAKIDGCSFRVRRDDCMDLPPKIYKRWPVELSEKQIKLYNELRDEYITEFKKKTLTAAMAMTRALRLQQILCGWFPMQEEELAEGEVWKKVIPIDHINPRIEALKKILETNEDAKVMVWARFRPDLELIQETFGRQCVSYHGGISNSSKGKNLDAFKLNPDVRIFNANQSSAGRGLNMSFATLANYYSNSYRLIDRTQSEDRTEGDEARRDSTLIIDLEAYGVAACQDTKIIKRLRTKKDIADLINRDPKRLFMEEDKDGNFLWC